MKSALYAVWQLTWGCLQSAAGFVLFLRYVRKPHVWFHGVLVTDWGRFGGVSLGFFVFAGLRAEDYSDLHLPQHGNVTPADCRAMLVHEYGHTVQSLLLGPLYLPLVGFPSVVWAKHPRCRVYRAAAEKPYASFYTEQWANCWGEAVLKEPSIRMLRIDA